MGRFKMTRSSETEEKELFQVKLPKSLIDDVNLMVKWSGKEKNFVVGEMFRYALNQEADFQSYRRTLGVAATETHGKPYSAETHAKPLTSERRNEPAAVVAR